MCSMCGIAGVISEDFELTGYVMKELLLQSQIRGRHATGIAFINSKNEVETFSQPKPAKQFIKHNFPESKMMLGHTRYSTSDIDYNQPIGNKEIAIVHNGIITQEAPENWQEHFGYSKFKTKNDTELLLKCIEARHNQFLKFPNASIACGILSKQNLICVRNNTRPLWIFQSDYFSGFASTQDIIKRTSEKLDIEIEAYPTEPFTEYQFFSFDDIREKAVQHDNKKMLFNVDQQ